MKRLIVIVLAVIIAAWMAGCDLSVANEPTSSALKAESSDLVWQHAKEKAANRETEILSKDGIVLVDNEMARISYQGIEDGDYAPIGGFAILLKVENKHNRTIMVQVRDELINDEATDMVMSDHVSAATTDLADIWIYYKDAPVSSISEIESIEFCFLIVDSNNWMDGVKTEVVEIVPNK